MKNPRVPATEIALGYVADSDHEKGLCDKVINFSLLNITGGNCPHSSGLISGAVTEVKTDIYVTSFGPVSDVEMVSDF